VFALFDIDEQGRCGSEHVPIIVENLVLSSYFWDSTLATGTTCRRWSRPA
jgi:hypothetical protein